MNLYFNNLKTKTMNKNLNFSKNFYIINITKNFNFFNFYYIFFLILSFLKNPSFWYDGENLV